MDKILSLIGLATKAGKTVSGEFSVEKAVKSENAELVIVAGDASDNTKKLFTDKCTYYKIPVFMYASGTELGKAVGKKFRASVAVLDEGFGSTIINMLRDNK